MYNLEATEIAKDVWRHVRGNGEPRVRSHGYGRQLRKASGATEAEVSSIPGIMQVNSLHNHSIIACLVCYNRCPNVIDCCSSNHNLEAIQFDVSSLHVATLPMHSLEHFRIHPGNSRRLVLPLSQAGIVGHDCRHPAEPDRVPSEID